MKKIVIIPLFLLIFVFPKAQTFTSNPNTTIIGGGNGTYLDPGGYTPIPLTVTGVGTINGIKGLSSVTLNTSNGMDVSDLAVKLVAPDGTTVMLSNFGTYGYSGAPIGANFSNTVFTESSTTPISTTTGTSGKFQPIDMLGVVNNGQNANGTWELCVFSGTMGDDPKVVNWSLTFDNTAMVQSLPSCSNNPPATYTCYNAPYICNSNGVCGQTNSIWLQSTWPKLTNAFCGVIDNNSFIKFVAIGTTASFNIWVYNDSYNGQGIQMMFFNDVCGCDSSGKQTSNPTVTAHGCINLIASTNRTPTLLTATGLTVGQTYFMMFDGYGGDVCNYTVKPIAGVIPLSFSVAPDSLPVCQGVNKTFTATGGLTHNYSWLSSLNPSGLSSTSGDTVTLTTGAVPGGLPLLISPVEDTITLKIQDTLSNCIETFSRVITILPQPTINNPTPISQSGNLNFTPTPLSIAPLTPGLTYQWYSSTLPTNNTTTATLITAATGATYSPPTNKTGTLYYFATVTNGVCSNPTSIIDTVTVLSACPPTVITTQPSSATVCPNIQVNLSVTANNAIAYTWYKNNVNSYVGGMIVGTLNTYSPSTSSFSTYFYYCIATGNCNSDTSLIASVTVNNNGSTVPNIIGKDSVCLGSTLQLLNPLPNGQWSSSAPSVASVDSVTGLVTSHAPGITNIVYTIIGTCGAGSSAPFQLMVLGNNLASPPLTKTIGCVNTSLTNIKIPTKGATGIGTSTGLPVGVTATWASDTITISGMPTISGSFYYHIPLTGGCGVAYANDTILVNPVTTSTTNIYTCTNDLPYSWNGKSYTSSTTDTVHLTNSNNCDSLAILHLSVNAPTSSRFVLCGAQLPYIWNSNTYNNPGVYTVHLTNINGCDSASTLFLNYTFTSNAYDTVCSSSLPYKWNGLSINAPGTQSVHFPVYSGCDSIAYLHLSVNNSSNDTIHIDTAGTYIWHGVTYTKPGIYTFDTTNSVGCDSLVTLLLNTVLPVRLIDVSALRNGNSVVVNWQTTEEHNTKLFIIQHSSNGIDFTAIATQKVIGSTYQFTDNSPTEGINYYRIQVIDNDGSSVYSKAIAVSVVENKGLSIHPNPAQSYATLTFPIIQKGNVHVYDVTGKVVLSQPISIHSGTCMLNTQQLASGMYMVRLTTEKATFYEKLLIKK